MKNLFEEFIAGNCVVAINNETEASNFIVMMHNIGFTSIDEAINERVTDKTVIQYIVNQGFRFTTEETINEEISDLIDEKISVIKSEQLFQIPNRI